jgi:prepilin-type N-terminal cleavage/methylation domain-containing protein
MTTIGAARRDSNRFKREKSGFTLIELSIVLVIIGLVVGGVLVGKDLIHQAELRNILAEKDRIVASVITFRAKYNCLPGDCKNATAFWGTDTSCPNTPSNAMAKRETCNGNDDGKINSSSTFDTEQFRFWQHLANAGLWPGEFTGAVGGTDAAWRNESDDVVVGQNMPSASFQKASGWLVGNLSKSATDSWWFAGEYGNFLTVGGTPFFNGGAGGWFAEAFLTPADTFGLDSKIDDGKPGTGIIRVNYTASASSVWAPCITLPISTTGSRYAVTTAEKNCNLIFTSQF